MWPVKDRGALRRAVQNCPNPAHTLPAYASKGPRHG
jgi:hypothetical protein